MSNTYPETHYLVDLPYQNKSWVFIDKREAENFILKLSEAFYAVALIEATNYGKSHCVLYTKYNCDIA